MLVWMEGKTMRETIKERLIRAEGIRLFPYKDSKGIWTIGVGHNIETDPIMFKNLELLKTRGISKEEAFGLLDKDIREHTAILLEALPWVANLDAARQSVLIELCFNMGLGNDNRGLLSFKNTLKNIQLGIWKAAAAGLQKSKWYSDVGPRRADVLIRIMLTGTDEIKND